MEAMVDRLIMARMTGPIRKLQRADRHFRELVMMLEKFGASKPYAFEIVPYPEAPDFGLQVQINHPIPDECGLIVGDFAHCTRSALDHIVFEISKLSSTDPWRKKLQFPIFGDRLAYKKREDQYLKGVDQPDRKIIERLQPYNEANAGPFNQLSALSDLNNADKHRVIPVVAAIGKLEKLSIEQGMGRGIEMSADAQVFISGSKDVSFFYDGVGDGTIREDGAILARLRIGRDVRTAIRPNVSAVIKFGECDAGVSGLDLAPTLAEIFERVRDIVGKFLNVNAQPV